MSYHVFTKGKTKNDINLHRNIKNFSQVNIIPINTINCNKEDVSQLNNFRLVSKKSLNKNLKYELTIDLWNIIFPKMLTSNVELRNRKKKYEYLQDYIYNKLCIKNFLFGMNDIDKLKYHLLLKDDLMSFESKQNPLPNSKDVKNVWTHEYLMPLPELLISQNN